MTDNETVSPAVAEGPYTLAPNGDILAADGTPIGSVPVRWWWRVDGERIDSREVVKVTPKQIVYLEPHWQAGKPPTERRSAKDTAWSVWFQTEAEAVEYVRARLVAKERSARESAERFAARLAAFNAAHPLQEGR